MKRGELSMEVIIIAVVALLVLAVLSYMIFGAWWSTNRGTECTSPSIGGECRDSRDACATDSRIASSHSCPEKTQVCCVASGTS